MKKYFLILSLIVYSITSTSAQESCSNLKSCVTWISDKTSAKYELGAQEKRTIKLNKDFVLSEGDPDFLFNFLLVENGLVRVKRENGAYQVIQAKDIKNFQFPLVKSEEIPNSLDYYSVEFSFSNKKMVKNAMQIFKKYLTKEGRLLEVADSPKILVTDVGIQLQTLRSIAKELNK